MAFYNEVPKGKGTISLGSQKLNVASYASDLLSSVQPIKVHSEAEAVAAVRDGAGAGRGGHPGRAAPARSRASSPRASATRRSSSTSTARTRSSASSSIRRSQSRINQVEQDVSKQVLQVAITDLQQVLNGGSVQILGQNVRLLGLRNARTIVQGTLASLPSSSPLRPALGQVISFADLAIEGLASPSPCSARSGRR